MSGAQPQPKAGMLRIAKAVFWSFFGIRRKSDSHDDALTIRPHQVIIAGLIGAALFVLTLVLVVRIITSQLAQ